MMPLLSGLAPEDLRTRPYRHGRGDRCRRARRTHRPGRSIARLRESRINAELKRDMLARGLSAEDIGRVIGAGMGPHEPEGAVPSSGEVVVEQSGEWHPAILLKQTDSRWFVHYVGTDSDENEWVAADRIRFPFAFFADGDFDSPIGHERRLGRESHAGYYAKPVPADHDLS